MKVEYTDDGEWEDVPGSQINIARSSRTPSVPPSPGATRTTTHRRKFGSHRDKKVSLAASTSSRHSASPMAQVREEPDVDAPPLVDREQLRRAAFSGALSVVYYVIDVVRTVLTLLKKPIGFLLFIIALAFMVGYVAEIVRPVFSPFCWIPGLSSSSFCVSRAPVGPTSDKPAKSANFSKLVELQSYFGGIVDETVGTSEMSLKIQQVEMATTDLATLVRVSDLTSRKLLADSLVQFIEDAKKTGEGLHRLSAKIGGAVDRITAVNDYAMHAIEAAEARSSFSLMRAIWPSRSKTDAVILRSFNDAMDVLAKETNRGLLEASISAANLERLQERLITIHEIATREGVALSEAHAELLSDLWTILGGNGHQRRKNEAHLALLRDIGQYRKDALAHVIVTRDALQALAADVEELREQAAAPEIVGDRVPPEVLIRSIANGIDRLKERRQRASERQQALMNKLLASAGEMLGIDGGET